MRAHGPALRRFGYRVRFDLADLDEGAALLLDGTEAAAVIDMAPADAPADCVLRLSSDDLARLIAGRLSPHLAFATGRLRIEGSRGVALKLASLLDGD